MIFADLILPCLEASSKKHALKLVTDQAVTLFGGDEETVLASLIEREKIGTTGIGHGAAIPHIKLPNITKMLGILATLTSPVDYDSIDGQPVDIIFMLLAPVENKTTQHLKMLAYISRFLKDEKTRMALRQAKTAEQISVLMDDWSKTQAA